MRQTVVGVFDSDTQAQRAAQELAGRGIDPACVHVTHSDDSTLSDGTVSSAATHHDHADTGVMGRVRNFFSDLFGPDDEREVGHYAEAVRRGHAVVKVDVDDDMRLEQVRDALQDAGAVDIDERVESWRAQGWSDDAYAGGTSGLSTAAVATNTTLDRDRDSLLDTRSDLGVSQRDSLLDERGTARAAGQAEDVIPVVQEELQVGKRTVGTGGVRVYSRTVEQPVTESVRLREEHAEVERRPVDRPATAADLADLQDRTIEVRETAEQAVVQKTARVVEEVRVGKTVEERTEQISDTVRHTEVEVEHLAGERTAGLDRYDADYRSDFSTRYAADGGRYEDYEPAYRYGTTLRSDPRYAGRQWDDVESDLRTDWETRHPGGTWERMKAAVRHGWDRIAH